MMTIIVSFEENSIRIPHDILEVCLLDLIAWTENFKISKYRQDEAWVIFEDSYGLDSGIACLSGAQSRYPHLSFTIRGLESQYN